MPTWKKMELAQQHATAFSIAAHTNETSDNNTQKDRIDPSTIDPRDV